MQHRSPKNGKTLLDIDKILIIRADGIGIIPN